MSGMFCAEIAAASASGSLSENEALTAYRAWMEQQFDHDCEGCAHLSSPSLALVLLAVRGGRGLAS